MPNRNPTHDFISRWLQSEAAERANYALFLSELCDFLDVPRPDPTRADEHRNTYVFEKAVDFQNLDGTISQGRIDLYKRAHFVLEAKQGSNPPTLRVDYGNNLIVSPLPPRAQRTRRGTAVRGTHGWDEAMLAARYQAEQYAKALPASEGWPPFLVTVDVGHSIELYADFSLTGKAYLPFPDPRSYRIVLSELAVPANRDRLRALWLDPHSLDPARHTARVTREVAAKLAILARTLEQQYPAKDVAEFLTRCIFTSFAEDVKLLPDKCWLRLLEDIRDRDNVAVFPEMASSLWATMNSGGFSPILQSHILRFNGGLFESTSALPLTRDQLGLLIVAADSNWRDVEPAIFGTLLERALDPAERHSLGAHYTPRAYVERLVIPTLVEPLRADWANTVAAIADLVRADKNQHAIDTALDFHRKLCNTRVLDPACGSGNFLYVALEHMKRLEGEVLETLVSLGESQQALEHTGLTVDPHQLLGIEINPRAAVVADLVLWIGYLQWHFRTRGDAQPPIPVIRNFHNIEHRDALLTWNERSIVTDEDGNEVSQWDGITTKEHHMTGRQVPDEGARRPVFHYSNPKQAKWPQADFIVGNPPFIGARYIRHLLGDGLVDALRGAYPEVPKTSDFVIYWWHRAAVLAGAKKIRRFGFVTTNSISQPYSRRLIEEHLTAEKNPVRIIYAIPDQPWVDSNDGADVRVAMTVGTSASDRTTARFVQIESQSNQRSGEDESVPVVEEQVEEIGANLLPTRSESRTAVRPLESNKGLCFQGVVPAGDGFKLSPEDAIRIMSDGDGTSGVLKPYILGRDITGARQQKLIIDLFGLTEREVRDQYPRVYQHLLDSVKPFRDQNARASYRDKWWIFAEPRPAMRKAISSLTRFIVTPYTAKFRTFVFVGPSVMPDAMAYAIAFEDAYYLGVLSCKAHLLWANRGGGRMGVGNDPRYISDSVFLPYPFPDSTEDQKQAIRLCAERLDAHRKRQQQLHPSLTLTEMYNVLEKLRADLELTEQDQNIYQSGLIGLLRELHDELDREVFEAYGWPLDLTAEHILDRLVVLNGERRAEEASGLIRWLRPEYQAPNAVAVTPTLAGFVEEAHTAARPKQSWPGSIPDQFRVIKEALRAGPLQTPQQIAAGFRPAPRTRVAEILATLTALGQARESAGRYSL